MNHTNLGIICGLIAMLSYGISSAVAHMPIINIGNSKTIFSRALLVSLFLSLMLPFSLGDSTFSSFYILIALAISVLGYIPLYTFYKALSIGKVGIVAPIAGSSVIITILLSVIFYGEKLTSTQAAAVALIVAGVILLSLDPSDLKNSSLFRLTSGMPYAIISCLLWGLVYFLIKIPVLVLGPVLTSFILEAGIIIPSGIATKKSTTDFALPDRKNFIYILVVAAFATLGTLCYNIGVSRFNVSIVAALTFTSPLITALYGALIYKEEMHIRQWLAIIIIITGIVLISFI